jgi:NAD(P)-dependent dehydrogenase (short-subunit alcohol dehydrogenase family)
VFVTPLTTSRPQEDTSTATTRRRLAGKVALITGATGQLGSTFVRAFAAAGADVVLTSRSRANLEILAAEVRSEAGARAAVVPADLREPEDVARLAQESWEAFGRVDVVVSNAIPPASEAAAGDVLGTRDAVWSAMHELIVWGPLRLCRALAPRMIDRGCGSIIMIVSPTGIAPAPGYDAYGLAKGSLLLLSRYMAREWGPHGIRVNAINPGTIVHGEGDLVRREAERLGVLERVSLGRLGEPEEVVGAALFLASDEAGYVSGQLLSVDGGRF